MLIEEFDDSTTTINTTSTTATATTTTNTTTNSSWSPASMTKPKQPRLFSHSLSTFGLNSNSLSQSCLSTTSVMSGVGDGLGMQSASNFANNLSVVSSCSSSSSPTVSSLASSSLGSFANYSAAMHGTVAGSSDDEPANKPNKGPTEILSFLYLGSQEDSLSEQTLKV